VPIYEYLCQDCGNKFEKLVRRSDDDVACPSCGKSHLKTELSTFAAHANGSPARSEMPSCPGGMCRTPDLCGRN
jgi:putative FmdB family regulatory protein